MDKWLSILSAMGTLLLMVAVFVGAYFVSKLVAKNYQPKCSNKGNMKVLEKMPIGRDQSLVIVEVAEQVYLIGVTANSITKLAELDKSLITTVNNSDRFSDKPNFMQILKDTYKNKKSADNTEDKNE